jgi:hypothetical protein
LHGKSQPPLLRPPKPVLDHARKSSYQEVVLWTSNVLLAARSLYAAFGFSLESSTPNTSFDPTTIDEFWRLRL